MVEPPTPVVDPGVSEGLAGLFAFAGSVPAGAGSAGLAALQQLIELGRPAVGAAGVAFVEFGRGDARVVAASGSFDWLRGRPVPVARTQLSGSGPKLRAYDAADLRPEVRRLLGTAGVDRLLTVQVTAAGQFVGYVALGYSGQAPPEPSTAQRAAAGLLGACSSALYLVGGGLPVDPAAGPADRQPGGEDRALFIAVTSHELRTPVTVIKGYADTLNEHWDQLDEQARRSAVSVIGNRSRDLGRLLDRLLSAAGDGIRPADRVTGAPFNLVEAVRAAVAELPADLHRHLRVQLPPSLPMALGERAAVATIVTELVTNACKYSTDRIDVELTAGNGDGVVWLRVADRGVGIRPEHVELAFERFWQLEPDERWQPGGVGLGLYLVRRLVERHQGWVSLRPRPGGGTVAEVRLPQADTGQGRA